MIDQLKGILQIKTPTEAIIFVGGIGFKINMSINSLESLPKIGDKVHILTYVHVREDILDLYGFTKKTERDTFHLLISISGIGPKLALTILSGVDPNKLKERIISGDIAALTRIPGVGNKTAKRIIIELKEKFTKINDFSLGFNEENENKKLYNDAINALISLGYKSNHAQKVCVELEKEGLIKGKLESVIKLALTKIISR